MCAAIPFQLFANDNNVCPIAAENIYGKYYLTSRLSVQRGAIISNIRTFK